MKNQITSSVVMMSLSLIIASSSLANITTVEAASKLPPQYESMYEALSGNTIDDYDFAEEDTSIPLEITGPSKIVIYDGDKLSVNDLLSKYKASRDGVELNIVPDKCYWISKWGMKMYNGKDDIVISSMSKGFDPTFVDITQHIVLEAKSWSDGSVARKNITLLVKHNKEKKVNKYVYMRCDVNVHEKPTYFSKNLGEDYNSKDYCYSNIKKIKYNTKVKVLAELKVGKYKWYKVKWNNKVGYIFADNASNKKLPTLKTYIHETDAADDAYQTYRKAERDKEEYFYDHNGKRVIHYGFSNSK